MNKKYTESLDPLMKDIYKGKKVRVSDVFVKTFEAYHELLLKDLPIEEVYNSLSSMCVKPNKTIELLNKGMYSAEKFIRDHGLTPAEFIELCVDTYADEINIEHQL